METSTNLPSGDARQTLARARAGDGEALEVLLRAHWRTLERMTWRRCAGSALEREELFGEALLRLCRHVTRLRAEEVAGFLAWFGRIVDRRILEGAEAERERVRPRRCRSLPWSLLSSLPFDPPAPGGKSDPVPLRDPNLARPRPRARERAICGGLALLLRDGLGVRNETVALVLGRSPAAARMLHHRALRATEG